MSTRSLVGTIDGTTFDGIYCHYDGYPAHMVRQIAAIIARDGARAFPVFAGKEVKARNGSTAWDSLSAYMPHPDTELPYPDNVDYFDNVPANEREPGVLALYAQVSSKQDVAAARDQIIEGYGVAAATELPRRSGEVGDSEVNTGWCEWAYMLTDDLSLVVLQPRDGLVEVERFTYEDLLAITAEDPATCERIQHAECGKDYSRCVHYAWWHDDTVPQESRSLGMREWLGLEPTTLDRAVAVVVGGQRHTLTGGGSSRGTTWVMRTTDGKDIPVIRRERGKSKDRPLPGVELILPPTKVEMTAMVGQ